MPGGGRAERCVGRGRGKAPLCACGLGLPVAGPGGGRAGGNGVGWGGVQCTSMSSGWARAGGARCMWHLCIATHCDHVGVWATSQHPSLWGSSKSTYCLSLTTCGPPAAPLHNRRLAAQAPSAGACTRPLGASTCPASEWRASCRVHVAGRPSSSSSSSCHVPRLLPAARCACVRVVTAC